MPMHPLANVLVLMIRICTVTDRVARRDVDRRRGDRQRVQLRSGRGAGRGHAEPAATEQTRRDHGDAQRLIRDTEPNPLVVHLPASPNPPQSTRVRRRVVGRSARRPGRGWPPRTAHCSDGRRRRTARARERRVDAARLAAMLTAGLRALLLQLWHPSIASAVAAHSEVARDPWRRYQSTVGFITA